jgi:hypothetical protein
MTRTALTLFALAGLSVWASAQNPAPGLTAGEQLRLFQSNRTLLDGLIDHGLKLSDANTPLDRADECRKAADTLGLALRQAAAESDADRVAELSDHLTAVVRDGLTPSLAQARRDIHPASADFERLKRVHADTHQSLAETRQALQSDEGVGRSARVRDARAKLADAADKIGEVK